MGCYVLATEPLTLLIVPKTGLQWVAPFISEDISRLDVVIKSDAPPSKKTNHSQKQAPDTQGT